MHYCLWKKIQVTSTFFLPPLLKSALSLIVPYRFELLEASSKEWESKVTGLFSKLFFVPPKVGGSETFISVGNVLVKSLR